MALIQAVVVGLIALIIAPGNFYYFDVTPKVVVLLVGAAVLLPGVRLVWSGFTVLAVAAVVWLGFSSALSANPALAVFGSAWRRFGAVEQAAVFLFAALVASHAAGRPDRARVILRGVAVAGALTALYGILQYFGVDPFLPAAAYHIGEGVWTIVRPPGTLGYVSYFANWLVMAAFLSAALASLETSSVLRRAAYTAAALAAFAMLLTGTRASMLGLVAGLAALAWSRGFRVSRRAIAVSALAAAGLVVFYYSPAGWNLRSRTRWFVEDPRGGGRLRLWRDTLGMALHRLPMGYGPDVFEPEFPHFESRQLARAYPDFVYESPHNIFLDAMVGQGLPGVILLASLCWLGLRKPGSAALGSWATPALVAGIVAHQFAVFTLPTAVLFFTAVALSAALGSKTEPPERNLPPQRLAAVPIALACCYLAGRMAVADQTLELVQHKIALGNPAAAAAEYAAYERRRLPGTAADLWYSRAMLGLAQHTADPWARLQASAQAGYAALRATTTAEDPFNAWYNASALYATENDAINTERSLRRAIDAHPNWFKPHWTLSRLLRLQGRTAEAQREAALAVDLDGGKDPEVAQAH